MTDPVHRTMGQNQVLTMVLSQFRISLFFWKEMIPC